MGSEERDGTLLMPELLSVACVMDKIPGVRLEGWWDACRDAAGVDVRKVGSPRPKKDGPPVDYKRTM